MKTVLGANHQFLFPAAMTDAEAHTESLKHMSQLQGFDALDCWLWRGERAKEEAAILKASGKIINYNIGDRFGEAGAFPASDSPREREYAYDVIMREVSYALELNSKKIVFGSGPDFPADRSGAKERFAELIVRVGEQLPDDVVLALEPTDRDIDKYFLFGPLDETVDFIREIRKNGFDRIGLLLDMCHIPLMHETIDSALQKVADTLVHIHLGNCMLSDKGDVYYGDKHPAWGYPGAEYGEAEAIYFIKKLKEIGYLNVDGNTVSFEMRPISGLSAEGSLSEFIRIWKAGNAI